MPATIQHDGGNLYRVQLSGLLCKAELEQVQSKAAEALTRLDRISILFLLDHFEGWERSSKWGELSFYMKHDKDLEKIAIVGEERWRDQALMFAGAGLRKAAVEFFTNEAAARAWLAK